MLRAISRLRAPLRSLPKTLTPSLFSPSPPPTRNPPAPAPIFIVSSPFSSKRKKPGKASEEPQDDDDDALGGVFVFGRDPNCPPKLFVVQPRLRPDTLLDSKLSEALNLANSLEEQRDGFLGFDAKEKPPHLVVQNPAVRSRPHSGRYFGQGTVDNIKCHLNALESQNGIDAIFVNAALTGIQQRNLEAAWGKPVLDRVGLIIEIFNAHAETKEAKLQSELAALMYKRSRLVRVRGPGGRLTFGASGEAEVVSARGRASGGQGFISGAGETEIQLQRRRIQERRTRLLAQIEEVRRTRALQRYSRKRHGGSQVQGLATIAVVGYTNAGKSTLVSALSDSDLYSDDRLFATVDPRLRSVFLPSGRKALLSDTVGFISDLPTQLVEAFHATLEEVVEADLLVHVLDSSAPNLNEQRTTVLQVLQQIGTPEEKIHNMIEVWNKIDLLKKDKGADEIVDGDEFLCEGENEEDSSCEQGNYSDVEDSSVSDLSSVEPEFEDGSESSDDMGSKLSSIESLDEDYSESMASELSAEERHTESEYKIVSTEPTEPKDTHHVQTSAVMGIGLQELLTLVDEKLSATTSSEKERTGPFDRKWRPTEVDRVAEG